MSEGQMERQAVAWQTRYTTQSGRRITAIHLDKGDADEYLRDNNVGDTGEIIPLFAASSKPDVSFRVEAQKYAVREWLAQLIENSEAAYSKGGGGVVPFRLFAKEAILRQFDEEAAALKAATEKARA